MTINLPSRNTDFASLVYNEIHSDEFLNVFHGALKRALRPWDEVMHYHCVFSEQGELYIQSSFAQAGCGFGEDNNNKELTNKHLLLLGNYTPIPIDERDPCKKEITSKLISLCDVEFLANDCSYFTSYMTVFMPVDYEKIDPAYYEKSFFEGIIDAAFDIEDSDAKLTIDGPMNVLIWRIDARKPEFRARLGEKIKKNLDLPLEKLARQVPQFKYCWGAASHSQGYVQFPFENIQSLYARPSLSLCSLDGAVKKLFH